MANEPVTDGRPKGWTEALCLEYLTEIDNWEDHELLAVYFIHGDWYEIHQTYPEFVKWMSARGNA